jgi:hypothetical protein
MEEKKKTGSRPVFFIRKEAWLKGLLRYAHISAMRRRERARMRARADFLRAFTHGFSK